MSHALGADAGHLVHAHPSSVDVEAWGPSRAGCLEELVRGMVETLGGARSESQTQSLPFRLGATSDAELVLALLDDLYFLFDSDDFVVADVSLHEDDDGNLDGMYSLVALDDAGASNSARKRTVRTNAEFAPDGPGWRALVVIDS